MSEIIKALFCNVCLVVMDKIDKEFIEIYDKCPHCNENDFKEVNVFD